MLTETSGLNESGFLPMLEASPPSPTADRITDRRREFDSILSHSLPRFRRIAMRLLRNPEDAEDAVQDAMLSAHRHIACFDGRSQMTTWITAILINAVRMQMRRRSRRPTVSLAEDAGDGKSTLEDLPVDPGPTPEQYLLQRELQALAFKLVARLPGAQQEALELRQRDLSIKEAAELLGISEGTLKARLARARAELHRRFRKITGAKRTRTVVPASKPTRETHFYAYRSAERIPPAPVTAFQPQGGGENCISA
jgi:RNA polymerase sigma-70 factor (ECF subfamily)